MFVIWNVPSDPDNGFGPWFLRPAGSDTPRNSVFPLIEAEATQLFRLAARWSVASAALAHQLRDDHAEQYLIRTVNERSAIAGLLAWQVATVELNLYRWSVDPRVNHWAQRLNEKTVDLSAEMLTGLDSVLPSGLIVASPKGGNAALPNALAAEPPLNAFVQRGPIQPVDPIKMGFRPGFFSTVSGARDLATLLRPTPPQALPADWRFLITIARSVNSKRNILEQLAEFDASLELPKLPSEVQIQESHPELNDLSLIELIKRGSELVRHATQIIDTDDDFWIGERSLELDGRTSTAGQGAINVGMRGNVIAESLASEQAASDLQTIFDVLALAQARQPTDKRGASSALGRLVQKVNEDLNHAGQPPMVEPSSVVTQMSDALGNVKQARTTPRSRAGSQMAGRQMPAGAPPQPAIPVLKGIETRVYLHVDQDPISPRFDIYWGPAELESTSILKRYSISEQTNALELSDVLAGDVGLSQLKLLDPGTMAMRVTADMIAEILGERLPKSRATRFARNELLRIRMEDPSWHPSIVPYLQDKVPWASAHSRLIIQRAVRQNAHTVLLTQVSPDGSHSSEVALHDLMQDIFLGRKGRVDQRFDTAGDSITDEDLRIAALIAYCRTPQSRWRVLGEPQSGDRTLLSFAGLNMSDVIALQRSSVELRTQISGHATTDTLRPVIAEPHTAKDILERLAGNELVDLGQRVYRSDDQGAIYARLLLAARDLEPGGPALLFMVHGAVKDTHKQPPSVWAIARSDTYGWQLFATNDSDADLPTAAQADSDLYKLIQPVVTNRIPVVLGTAPIGDEGVIVDDAMQRTITEKRVVLELTTGTRTRHDLVSLITDDRHPLQRVLVRIDRQDDRRFSERQFLFSGKAGSLTGGNADASEADIERLVHDLQLVFLEDYRLQIRQAEGKYTFSVVPLNWDTPDWLAHLEGSSSFEGQQIFGLYLRPAATADVNAAGDFAEPVLALRAGTGRFRLVPFALEDRVAVPIRAESEELTASQFHRRRHNIFQPMSSAVRWNSDGTFGTAGVEELTEDGRASAWLRSLPEAGRVCAMPHRDRFVNGEFARVVIPRKKTVLCLDYEVNADGKFKIIGRSVMKSGDVTELMRIALMQPARPEIRATLGDAWQLRDGYELIINQRDVDQQVFVDLADAATAWQAADINLIVRVGNDVHGLSLDGDSAVDVWSSPAAETEMPAEHVHEIDVTSLFDKAFGDSPRTRGRLYEVLGDTARSALLQRHLEAAPDDNVFRTVEGDIVEIISVDVDEALVSVNTREGERLMPVGGLVAMLEQPVLSVEDDRDHSLGERVRAAAADFSGTEIGTSDLAPGYLEQLSRITIDRALAEPCAERTLGRELF